MKTRMKLANFTTKQISFSESNLTSPFRHVAKSKNLGGGQLPPLPLPPSDMPAFN